MSDLVLEVAAAITNGLTLMTPRHTVGPYRFATAHHEDARFACLDLQCSFVMRTSTWRETTSAVEHDRKGWGAGFVERSEPDWSAFGAAYAFVSVEAPASVRKALEKAKGAPREPAREIITWKGGSGQLPYPRTFYVGKFRVTVKERPGESVQDEELHEFTEAAYDLLAGVKKKV